MPAEYRLILKYADAPGYTPELECYLRHGGYEALKKALAIQPKTLADGRQVSGAEQIRDDVKLSGLRGRGGAGFSCGLKWSFVDRASQRGGADPGRREIVGIAWTGRGGFFLRIEVVICGSEERQAHLPHLQRG
jgi:hypothetical protein